VSRAKLNDRRFGNSCTSNHHHLALCQISSKSVERCRSCPHKKKLTDRQTDTQPLSQTPNRRHTNRRIQMGQIIAKCGWTNVVCILWATYPATGGGARFAVSLGDPVGGPQPVETPALHDPLEPLVDPGANNSKFNTGSPSPFSLNTGSQNSFSLNTGSQNSFNLNTGSFIYTQMYLNIEPMIAGPKVIKHALNMLLNSVTANTNYKTDICFIFYFLTKKVHYIEVLTSCPHKPHNRPP
jgi:hypothetical protein